MSRLAVLFIAVVVAVLAGLVWYRVIPNPFGGMSSGNAVVTFRFQMFRNEFGDRVFLNAPVHLNYVSLPDAPDRVDISPEEGALEGTFLWTVIQRQGSDDRLIGEFSASGRAYRVCEFLQRGKEEQTSAERYYPINNSGSRFRNPERMDPERMHALFDAIVAEETQLKDVPKGSTETVSVSRALVQNASDMVYYCLNQIPPGRRAVP